MSSILFPDLAIARLLEGAEAASSLAFCDAAAQVHPEQPIRSIPCVGGFGLIYGPADPLNAVKGAGLNGPVDPREWDALEAVFKECNSPIVIDLCPLADEAFITLLADRGYRTATFETVTFQKFSLSEVGAPAPLAPDVAITLVNPADAAAIAAWSRVIGVGFADGGEPMKFAVDFGRVRSHMASRSSAERVSTSLMFLATVNGEPAGGAGLSIHHGLKVAHFAGAAVLPRFRRRGIQTALTATRIRAARDHGCTYGKFDVRAGSVSHHNAVRAGFQVAYTRPQMIRSW